MPHLVSAENHAYVGEVPREMGAGAQSAPNAEPMLTDAVTEAASRKGIGASREGIAGGSRTTWREIARVPGRGWPAAWKICGLAKRLSCKAACSQCSRTAPLDLFAGEPATDLTCPPSSALRAIWHEQLRPCNNKAAHPTADYCLEP